MTKELCTELFETTEGKKIYLNAIRAMDDFSMHSLISRGVLVGFSGGADSILLLLFLCEYRKRCAPKMKITAVHVNHGIRGEEAERDEKFSKETAALLGVDFIVCRENVPSYAEACGMGLEEAAREIRYKRFYEIIEKETNLSAIAVAHNASDNLETVVFNMLRGTGLKGMSGISPVRDNIVRPLIYISKDDIVGFLEKNNIEFVTDSTNFSCDYTRNYIRCELVPKFKRLAPNPENSVSKMCTVLREDNEFIESLAEEHYCKNIKQGRLSRNTLAALHPSLFYRVFSCFCKKNGISAIEYVHAQKARELISAVGNFELSLPFSKKLIIEYDSLYFSDNEAEDIAFSKRLSYGFNKISNFGDVIYISDSKIDNSSLNVYKISIQAVVNFDIISKAFYVRSKNDGDKYRYSGMTHKLKKLFSDLKIPEKERYNIPVFSSETDVLWVPGFGISEELDVNAPRIYIAVLKPIEKSTERAFYIPRNSN